MNHTLFNKIQGHEPYTLQDNKMACTLQYSMQ
jgi:hypothetical protein